MAFKRFCVTVGDTVLTLDVQAREAGSFEVRSGERVLWVRRGPDRSWSVSPDVAAVQEQGPSSAARRQSIVLDSDVRPRNAALRGHAVALHVVPAELAELAQLAAGGRSVGVSGDAHVRSPMHGRVVKLMVEPSSPIRAGQPVAIVEAMKMENEVVAPHDGVVRKIHAAVGDSVETGHVLVEVEALDNATHAEPSG